MITVIKDNTVAIKEICKRYGVAELYVFGSALGEGFDPASSDIDIAVNYKEGIPVLQMDENYFGLIEDLEELLGVAIDLVTLQSVRNNIFKAELERTMVPLYAA